MRTVADEGYLQIEKVFILNYEIAQAIDQAGFEGELTVAYQVAYPSQVDCNQSVTYKDWVVYPNLLLPVSDELKAHVGVIMDEYINQRHKFEDLALYDCAGGSVFFAYWEVDFWHANADSVVAFCFSGQGDRLQEACTAVAALSERIW
tara:strand:- start:34 stop:477 length:444 start_codon:yes stop_codon:yes gene_type:complete